MGNAPQPPPVTDLTPHLERNRRGRDLVVGDVHGHFETLRHALAELAVDEHDRVFSLGDLVDRGPDSFQAKDWMGGCDPSAQFDLVLRGNHEQMMLRALLEGPPRRRRLWDQSAWSLWEMNGGGWWGRKKPRTSRGCVDRPALRSPVLREGADRARTGRSRACLSRARELAGPRGRDRVG